jgi:inorganic pyrophosphatase
MKKLLHELDAFAEKKQINIVVETAKGSGSKFKYDPDLGLISLHRSLPKGHVFPYDYGFIPSTVGEDGDPLDALVLLDTDVFPGCLVQARMVGIIEAKQEGGVRNDCVIAIHRDSAAWDGVSDIKDLPSRLIDQIVYFFDSYRDFQGKDFRAIGRKGCKRAEKAVREGVRRFQRRHAAV